MSRTDFVSRLPWSAGLWLLFAAWLVALWILSSQPGPPGQLQDPLQFDKVLHFLYFALGAAILTPAVARTFALRGGKLAAAVVGTLALIGLLDEWHQTFTPHRSGADPFDWAADCAGAIAAVVVLVFLHGKIQRIQKARG